MKCMSSGRGTQGAEVEALEEEFAEYVGAKYAVAVDSCTNGLFLALSYQPCKREVPTLTFASVANAVVHSGCELVFVDNSYVGRAYELKGKYPVWDCAHQVIKVEGNGAFVYSFYPTKNISSCEGGMIATNNKEIADYCRLMRFHGKVGSNYDYQILEIGHKMNMTDVQAAIARVQLKKFDENLEKRAHLTLLYSTLLHREPDSLHLYRLEVTRRDALMLYLKECGIECSIHFKTPLHKQPAYKVFSAGEFTSSEWEADHTISLPLYPSMTDDDVKFVCGKVQTWLSNL